MSVLEEFRKAEQQVVNRLRELQPLVAEHEQLRKVAERLGLKVGERPSATQPEPQQRRMSARRSTRAAATGRSAADGRRAATTARTRAGGGRRPRTGVDRQSEVLRLVQERPGITVREVAQELSVDATGLYRVVRRLQQTGQVTKDGVRLHPAQGPHETPAA